MIQIRGPTIFNTEQVFHPNYPNLTRVSNSTCTLLYHRFNDIVGGEGRPDLPLTLGSDLTPIPDVEEEMELSAGGPF